jgi:hypothetical protein
MTYQFHQEHALPIHASATVGQGNQLTLRDYSGESFPNLIHPESFPNITSLSIYSCNGLKSISISQNPKQPNQNKRQKRPLFNNMVCDSFVTRNFSSLVDVTIEKCENLSSLENFLQPDLIPAIKKIVIADCQNLELVPTERFGYLRFLEELKLCNCPKINSQRLLAPYLTMLELNNSGDLGGYIDCGFLTVLHLSGWRLSSIELQNWSPPLLQELNISNCAYLAFTRNNAGSSTFPSLIDIIIKNCQDLSSLEQFLEPAYIPAIKKIVIEDCSNLELVPTERFAYLPSLEVLEVRCWGIQENTSPSKRQA